MTRLACLSVFCGVFLLGACGDDGPSVDVNEGNICSEAAEVVCYDLYRCCTEGEIEDVLGVTDPRSQDECRADLTHSCERAIATVQWSMDEGRVELDAASLDACLTALIAPGDTCVTIDSVAPWAEACATSAFTGTVQPGGDCFYDIECAGDGSYCADDRTCQDLPGDGDPCGGSGCQPSLFCDAGTCAPLLGTGDPCFSSTQCDDGLFCDVDATNPTCKAQGSIGDACGGFDQCDETSTCLQGSCPNGNGCYNDNDCFGACENDQGFCFDDSDCGNGTCSVAGTGCASDFNCPTGETCDFPFACIPGACEGGQVCAENIIAYDYCEDVRSSIPF